MKKWVAGILGLSGIGLVAVGTGTIALSGKSISIIKGSDGPTSVFLAGKVGDDNSLFLIGTGAVMILAAIVVFFIKKGKE